MSKGKQITAGDIYKIEKLMDAGLIAADAARIIGKSSTAVARYYAFIRDERKSGMGLIDGRKHNTRACAEYCEKKGIAYIVNDDKRASESEKVVSVEDALSAMIESFKDFEEAAKQFMEAMKTHDAKHHAV